MTIEYKCNLKKYQTQDKTNVFELGFSNRN
jgi:hypothetical protein